MPDPVHVFAISHSCVVSAYRMRHEEVARHEHEDVRVTLLTPERWQQFNRMCISPERDESHTYELIRRQPWSFGIPDHGLRNATHCYPGLAGLIAAARPDLLELWEEPFSLVGWQAARAFRRINPTGPILFFSAQNVRKWRPPPYSWFERAMFSRANMCLAMNEDVTQVLRDKGWSGRSEVLPLGIDPDAYSTHPASDDLKQMHGLAGVTIGFVGKLTEQKGILDLLTALEELDIEDPFSALIVGSGELEPEIRERVARRLPFVNLQGAVPHEEMPRMLSLMDIVVMPSRTVPGLKEQFGRVAVEAMAAGKAVVVSDSGEPSRVVSAAGSVFPAGDAKALAEILADLIRNRPKRTQFGAAARERAVTSFSWSSIAERQISFYKELLA